MKYFFISTYKKYYGSFFFIFLCFSLFIGFFLNEDASGGGNSRDFYITLPYIEVLRQDVFSISTKWTVHFPLHYILLSKLSVFSINEQTLRFYFTCISILIPILFYYCIKIKFDKKDSNLLLALSSIIFVIPAFRYSAIWANAQNTAYIFFLLSIYFFFKWEKKKINFIDVNIIFHLITFFLAIYSRQYFIFFIFYFLYIYLLRLTLKNNIVLYAILLLFSLPAVILVLSNITFLSGTGLSIKFYNSLLINFSILSFYLIPIFFINYLYRINQINIKKNFIYFTFLFFIISFLAIFFDYNHHLGGGFFLKSSRIILNNNFLFYFSSLLGLFFISIIARENIINLITLVLLVFCFSGSFIYQKYFEPLFFIFFFLFLNTKYYEIFFLKLKAILFLLAYISIYLLLCIFNNLYQITNNIL